MKCNTPRSDTHTILQESYYRLKTKNKRYRASWRLFDCAEEPQHNRPGYTDFLRVQRIYSEDNGSDRPDYSVTPVSIETTFTEEFDDSIFKEEYIKISGGFKKRDITYYIEWFYVESM